MKKANHLSIHLLRALVGSCSYILIVTIICSFFGKHWWIFDLTSHFRVQYALYAFPIIIALFLFRRIKLAAALLAVSLTNAFLLAPHLIKKPQEVDHSRDLLSAILLNVNTHMGSPERVEAFVLDIDPDLLILEEINSHWIENLPEIGKRFPFQTIRTRDDNFGIALFSKYPLSSSKIKTFGDYDTPTILANLSVRGQAFDLIGAHTLPPRNSRYSKIRNQQLSALANYAASKTGPTLLLGDLNITPFSYHFREFIKESGLSDSSEHHGIQSTWPTFFPLLQIPIDHVLHTNEIVILEKQIGPKLGSDHFPIIIHFYVNQDEQAE